MIGEIPRRISASLGRPSSRSAEQLVARRAEQKERRATMEGSASTSSAAQQQQRVKAQEDSDDEPEHLQYKVILLGDGAVGKTSVANRFTDDHFAMTYKQTIGLDFFIKRLVLPGDVRVPPPPAHRHSAMRPCLLCMPHLRRSCARGGVCRCR